MRVLPVLILLALVAIPVRAQPVRSSAPPVRLTVEVMEAGAYRLLSPTENAAASSVTERTPWRMLIDGEPVREVDFYRQAGESVLVEKAVRQRRGAQRAIAGGVVGVVVGMALIGTSNLWQEDVPLATSQLGLGTSVALLGMTAAVAGGFGMDRKATTIWQARGAANRYNEQHEAAR